MEQGVSAGSEVAIMMAINTTTVRGVARME
jgi:hypothetical protein